MTNPYQAPDADNDTPVRRRRLAWPVLGMLALTMFTVFAAMFIVQAPRPLPRGPVPAVNPPQATPAPPATSPDTQNAERPETTPPQSEN